MTSFQKGDRVQCIKPIDGLRLNAGYVIAKTHPYDGMEDMVEVEGLEGWYFTKRFQLIQPMAQSFKKGDILDQRPGFALIPGVSPVEQVRVYKTHPDNELWLDLETLDGRAIPRPYHSNSFSLAMAQDNEIKAGDKVRCNTTEYGSIVVGARLDVIETRKNGADTLRLRFATLGGWYAARNFEKVVEERKLVGYTLKKDLPDVKAGALLTKQGAADEFNWQYSTGSTTWCAFNDTTVRKADWFEPVYEKPNQEITLKSGKTLVVSYKNEIVYLKGGQDKDKSSFKEVRDIKETWYKRDTVSWGSSSTGHPIQPIVHSILIGCVEITRDELNNILQLINT